MSVSTKDVGTKAPPLSLKTAAGESFSVVDCLRSSPLVILAFFKTTCPVCQTTFPFLQRLQSRFPETQIWGISQDDAEDTAAFAHQYKISFPLLLDETLEWTVKYGLVSVPTIFTVAKDATIKQAIFGFVKSDLEELNGILAECAGKESPPLFTDADDVPTMRPG